MALLVRDVGEAAMLTIILSTNVVLHLYTNDGTPTEDDVVGDYTEATEAGYEEAELTGGSWTVSTTAGVTTGVYAQQDFVITEAATVYGYYVTDVAGTTLLWAERFGTTATLGSGGGTISIIPSIELE